MGKMVKALSKGYKAGTDLLIFGLTSENIRRLMGGEPILVRGDTVGRPDTDTLILFGHTVGDIQSELVRGGFELPDPPTAPDKPEQDK